MPLKPIRINCQTCEGKKEVDEEYIVGENTSSIKRVIPVVKIPCPNCNGTGEYSVKRL